MTEKFGSNDQGFAFLGLDEKLMFDESLKDLPNIGNVRGGTGREDDDIVEIDNTRDIHVTMEGKVFVAHRGGGGVSEAERRRSTRRDRIW